MESVRIQIVGKQPNDLVWPLWGRREAFYRYFARVVLAARLAVLVLPAGILVFYGTNANGQTSDNMRRQMRQFSENKRNMDSAKLAKDPAGEKRAAVVPVRIEDLEKRVVRLENELDALQATVKRLENKS